MPPKKKDEPEKHHGSVYLGGLYDGDKLLAIFFYHQDFFFIIDEMSSSIKTKEDQVKTRGSSTLRLRLVEKLW